MTVSQSLIWNVSVAAIISLAMIAERDGGRISPGSPTSRNSERLSTGRRILILRGNPLQEVKIVQDYFLDSE
jgi:hypothetical protein